jgi:hypothetical protein
MSLLPYVEEKLRRKTTSNEPVTKPILMFLIGALGGVHGLVIN